MYLLKKFIQLVNHISLYDTQCQRRFTSIYCQPFGYFLYQTTSDLTESSKSRLGSQPNIFFAISYMKSNRLARFFIFSGVLGKIRSIRYIASTPPKVSINISRSVESLPGTKD